MALIGTFITVPSSTMTNWFSPRTRIGSQLLIAREDSSSSVRSTQGLGALMFWIHSSMAEAVAALDS